MDQAESTIGPVYTQAEEMERATGVPKGTVHNLTMDSIHSKAYPGVARKDFNEEKDKWIEDSRFRGLGVTPDMWISEKSPEGLFTDRGYLRGCSGLPDLFKPGVHPYQRKIVVYVPHGLDTSVPAPFLVFNDGGRTATGYMVPMLDMIISQGRIPATVVLFIPPGGMRGNDAQGSQRGVEYDKVSGDFADFVENVVVPLVSKDCNLLLTSDPEGRATMGYSSGGAAAFSMAWHHPGRFRRVLVYSPTLCNQQYPFDPDTPSGAWDYHSGKELVANSEHKPLRICIYSMENDLGYTLGADTCRNLTEASCRMAAVLRREGYTYRHVFCKEAEHVDERVLAQTLPGALEWLWQGYKPGM